VFNLPPFDTTSTSSTREKWLDTLRGRFGYTPWERFMIYGTAGVAFTRTEISVFNPAFGTVTDSQIRSGWVAGLGAEWAAWRGSFGDITFKAEWLHAGFTTHNFFDPQVTVAPVATVVTRLLNLSDDIFRVGLNWKFNPWATPIVARY